jgi:Predicted membrane protein (DUF2142)
VGIRLRLIPALVVLGLALLLAAWVAATRPFGAPDENWHYLRALSIANGSLLGPRVPVNIPGHPAATAWFRQDTRGVLVPARLSPVLPLSLVLGRSVPAPAGAIAQPMRCLNGRPNVGSGSCMEASDTGDYPPLPYLLPAIVLKSVDSWRSGLWLSRALSAGACLTFILLSIAALWSGGGWSLLGLLIAITPMVLFVSSVINPDGLESAAAIAFAAAGLRLVRDRGQTPAWIFVALACSGAVTVLAWQLGPVFVVIDLAVFAGLLGRRRIRDVMVHRHHWIGIVGLALVAALGLYVSWAMSSGGAHAAVHPTLGSLRLGVGQLHRVFQQAVGKFGWLTVPMRSIFVEIWWALVVALLGGAVFLGRWRERVVALIVTMLVLLVPVLFYAWVYRFSGSLLQGRHMLPLLVLVPLVCGEVVHSARSRIPSRASKGFLAAAIGTVAVVQLAAWWTSARAAAARQPYTWFVAHATWAPPLGWWPWIGMAIVGSMAIAASGAVVLRSRTPARALVPRATPQPQGGTR